MESKMEGDLTEALKLIRDQWTRLGFDIFRVLRG